VYHDGASSQSLAGRTRDQGAELTANIKEAKKDLIIWLAAALM